VYILDEQQNLKYPLMKTFKENKEQNYMTDESNRLASKIQLAVAIKNSNQVTNNSKKEVNNINNISDM